MRPSDDGREAHALAAAQAVLARGKYACVCQDLVLRISRAESAKGRSGANLEKAVRGRLHQVCGAFLPRRAVLDRNPAESAPTTGLDSFKAECEEMMRGGGA